MKKRRVKIKGYRPKTGTLTVRDLEKYLYEIFTARSGYVRPNTSSIGLVYEDENYEMYQVADNIYTGRKGWETFNKIKNEQYETNP